MRKFSELRTGTRLTIITSITISFILVVFGLYTINRQKASIISKSDERLFEQVSDLLKMIDRDIKQREEKIAVVAELSYNIFQSQGHLSKNGSKYDIEVSNQDDKYTQRVEIPVLLYNNRPIYKNYDLLQNVQGDNDVTNTIFQKIDNGYLRISTTLVNASGERQINTYIPSSSPVAQALDRGETFKGRSKVMGEWYRSYYKPLKIGNSVVGAYAFALPEKDLSSLQAFFSSKSYYKQGYPYVVENDGTFLIHPTSVGQNISNESFFKEMVAKGDGKIKYMWQGKAKYQHFKYDPTAELYVATTIYESDLLAEINSVRAAVLVVVIAGVILSLVIGLLIGRTFQKNISNINNEINTVVNNILNGKLDKRVNEVETNFEFRGISIGFNKTVDSIVSFLDALPTPVMVIDTEYNIQYMNQAGSGLDNRTSKQVIGKKCFDHFKTNDCKTGNCACTRTISSGRNEISETTARPGNNMLEISYSAVPLKDVNGKVIGAFEVVTDQTAIKQAMKKMEKIGNYQNRESIKLTNNLKSLAIGDLGINLSTEASDDDTADSSKMFEEINKALNSTIQSNREIVDKARLIADGDLTVSLEKRSGNDDLMDSLNEMVKSTARVIAEFQTAAENISGSSQQMSSTAQQMSQGATEQASSAEEVSSSMEEMAANITQNTDNAQQTQKIALNASEGIAKVAEAARHTLKNIEEIADKVSIIGEIARQTNILALNAAVEAARAGEHGKGFAVVAAEVRKLAERSQVSAVEIDSLTKSSVRTTDDAGKLMAAIVPEINKTAKLVQEIAAASIEQNSGAEQVNNAIQQLNQVTQQNAAASEEVATSSEELSSQAEQLLETLRFFKLENETTRKVVKPRQEFNPIVNAAHITVKNKPYQKTMQPKKKGFTLNMDKSDSIDNDYEKF